MSWLWNLGLNGERDGGRKKTSVGHHRRRSGSASSKDTGRPARQPAEPANRVASRLSSAVGKADHEKDRRRVRRFPRCQKRGRGCNRDFDSVDASTKKLERESIESI